MPLFKRSDGDLVSGESPLRRVVPYVMSRRSDSLVFHTARYRVGKARRWLAALERAGGPHLTLFELFLWAGARTLHAHPRLNRFVSGGRLYQRRGVFLSFVALAGPRGAASDPAAVTVKLAFPPGESLPACGLRIAEAIRAARAGREAAEKPLALTRHLPGPLLRAAVGGLKLADRWNLLPARWIADDPLFTSAFLANLGSLGIDQATHHLYEYGTASVFGVLGKAEGDQVKVGWTFDERSSDGHDCARALDHLRGLLEDPQQAERDPAADHQADLGPRLTTSENPSPSSVEAARALRMPLRQ